MVYDENSKYLAKDTAENYEKYLPKYYFFDDEIREYVEETVVVENKLSRESFNSVLEFGVGSGRITELLMPISKKYKGIDISDSMIKRINRRFPVEKSQFEVFDINEFINQNIDGLRQYDFIGSYWAFNYAILSFFEYRDLSTGKTYAIDNLTEAEEKAKEQITKLFSNLSKGTKFLFLYFDAYSVEQSYVTSVLEQSLPFPYNDRGFTFRLFKKILHQLESVKFVHEHKSGFVILDDDEHLIEYFKNLHLKGYLDSDESIELLMNTFRAYKYEDGHYEIPAGMNIISGNITI
ncbi:methyltransferase domain-containing protein [Pseudolactococcus reticulitermitis]|uniref:Methyltransferase type 11 domain-containing protein n=1 Tax=Pseudolactococcus reticulitermitis TaxID=2025039 RepID=A0A224X232_9LACT|nr:methyltransferase domain-containing protein [Lactococcus reticulitermitis]GAX48218.1 hypothetical protein RsY01_1833 [Lactococcus reticulitermitis]